MRRAKEGLRFFQRRRSVCTFGDKAPLVTKEKGGSAAEIFSSAVVSTCDARAPKFLLLRMIKAVTSTSLERCPLGPTDQRLSSAELLGNQPRSRTRAWPSSSTMRKSSANGSGSKGARVGLVNDRTNKYFCMPQQRRPPQSAAAMGRSAGTTSMSRCHYLLNGRIIKATYLPDDLELMGAILHLVGDLPASRCQLWQEYVQLRRWRRSDLVVCDELRMERFRG